jgi:hypothetical protein
VELVKLDKLKVLKPIAKVEPDMLAASILDNAFKEKL